MKFLLALTAIVLFITTYTVEASVYVKGYTRKDGTYVPGYYRSSPDSTITNNYSYCGNTNPYTGSIGTVGCGSSSTSSLSESRQLNVPCISDSFDMTEDEINAAHDDCDASLKQYLGNRGILDSSIAISALEYNRKDREDDLKNAKLEKIYNPPIQYSAPLVQSPLYLPSDAYLKSNYEPTYPRQETEVETFTAPLQPIPQVENWPLATNVESIAPIPEFIDIDSNTHFATAIRFLQLNGIVSGFTDGTFKPNESVTRAELLKMALLAKLENEPPLTSESNCFSDLTLDMWVSKFACYAKANNLVNGYKDGSFQPNRTVTYAEALKITLNVFGLNPPETNPWYKAYVNKANEIRAGVTYTELGDSMTRAKMAELLTRVLKYQREGADSYYLIDYKELHPDW